ncbi:uncharacterized protein LOC133927941 isoform X2 [Phragmites australis]|uniref:uncharacterized protein LOC133927941 isoform X2 n=1 Tax=Phragmites australis TaxID=29695 RepID=UPI002D769527|nr:uncharacterized protein LOC133927941 isoform X2 [Phragmites australis]
MATPSYASVKCLNTSSSSRKRFMFKRFSQRVEEIDIDVYRSLHAVKAEPSGGSSFFLDTLVEWRELNTAEDFISLYEEMMPLVQTLPQIVLHREKLFSALQQRVNMSARLSLEPILMLIAALSRDILEDFLPFLGRYANAILALLKDGGDRDPEILEQVFTSWSYIMMYMQKYLVKDVVQILRITATLRYFSKDYVREFMAESVSFLLRNAPNNQLTHGLMKVLLEAVKKSSPIRIDGVTALLWNVMKGTSTKLHSRAEKVLKFLLSKSTFTTIHDKFPDGSSTIHEVMTGLIQRLCDEVDLNELPLIYTCLFEEINSCIKDGCLEHLKCLIDFLTFSLQNNQSDVFDKVKMLKLAELLVSTYVLPGSNIAEASSSKVLESILDFLLCVLDVPVISGNLSIVSPFYAPVFKLTNSSMIIFMRKLLAKASHIIHHFENQILSAMDNFLGSSPEEVLFILLNFFKGSKKQIILHSTDGNHPDPGEKVSKFVESKFSFWIELLDDIVNGSSSQVSEKEAAILWGYICLYPNMNGVHRDSLSLLKKLICNLDRILEVGEENMSGLPKTTWRSLLGAALSSYHELLLVNTSRNSELNLFISLAKRHSTCPQVLSAVAEYLDSVQGVASLEVTEEFDPQNLLDLFSIFAVNLSSPNKDVRILTLRILSYFVKMDKRLGTNEERPHKRQRTEDSGEETVTKYTNVVDTLLAVESTPISVSTCRKIAIFISRIQMNLSSKMVLDDYIPPLLHGIIGILYNRFSDLWPPTLDCLAVLIRKHKELVWSQFVQFIAIHQSKGLTLKNQEKLEAATQPQSIFDCFSLYLAMDFDCTPVETIATLLLQSLQRIPDVAESRSRNLIPLFLNFMGYDDGDVISADSYVSDKCKGKQWKMILKEWLNMLTLMHNARSLYQSKILQEVLTKRVLDDSDPDIQAKALDCLLNWKDEFLTPYSQNLKNLVDVKTLREELTTWAVSHDSLSIQKDHRSRVVPLVIRVLTPKARKLKLLGSRKHTGVSHRKAILRFLLQFDSNELQLFFSLLLKSLIPGNLQLKMFGSQSDNLLRNISDIVGASAEICIENFTWKKANGFLHLVEEIFGTFDMAHISPFLNGLLIIVARLLESCMHNLRIENYEKYHCKQSSDLDNDCSMNLEVDNSTNVKECPKEMPVVDHTEASASIKQLKDLRSLCIRIVSSALSHYESHDFGENFWNTFFASVKPLIDCFTQEASSSEKPSSLFSCFMAMSRSPTLAPLLGVNNLVPAIFSILTVKTASGSITSYALEFIENLLRLDIDLEQQDDHSMKKILVPHMDVLLHSLHDFVNHRKELHRRSGTWLGQRELRLFKLLLNYITDASAAERVIDLILPFFSKKDLNSDECLEALRVVRGIIPNLRCGVSHKILSALNPLLATVGLELRLCICDIYDGLSLHESSMSSLARLMQDLNAVSTSELGEVDYDTRLDAYDKVKPHLFLGMKEEYVGAVLSHCVYDMSSEELIFRQSASRALQSFLDFSASVMNNESKYSIETADIKPGENDTRDICTKGCIQQILEKTYLHNMGVAMTKDISIQKEWIILLREMVYNFNHVASLTSFRPLCREDLEEDFFHNITHLQAGKRSKALSLFRQGIKEHNFSEDITMKVFIPLFFNMFSDVKAGKGEQVRDVCLDTLSSVAAKVQWEHYRTILMRCFRELSLKPDKQKIILRLICAVLDAFHFMKPANDISRNSDAMNEDSDSSLTFSSTTVSADKQHYLQKVVFPQVQKLLGADPEKVNVNINLVALKILKLLPVHYFESQLSSIIHRICNFLKNRLESIRDEARAALAASLKELGIGYLQFVVKILRAILKRGFELHVLGYTLHYLLSKTITADMNGRLDYCLEDLLAVVYSDLLGDVAEQKEVEKLASKMKETKKRMSFETLKLIAQSITFQTHNLKLISPSYLQKRLTPKLKTKLELMLHNIALGIECNPSTETSNLFIFVYRLIEDTITGSESECKANMESGPGQVNTLKRNFPGLGESGAQNSHILTKFALALLRCRLKSIKLEKGDEQLLSMLDPFVNLLRKCLNSKYESVLSVAFRCLALLVKLPLPSLRDNANPIKNVLMDIAQRAGNANSHLVTSCLKLLADLLRWFRISLSGDQLQMIVHFPMFVDLRTNPSPVALSLLKAIVRRKLVSHEIYDIVVKIGELMVTTLTESIRQQCIQILLQFFLNYPLSEKRLQQHIDFFLANLSYEHPSGREAVLEMLHDILTRFPQRIIDDQGQTFFLHLVVALANEQHQNVSPMILRAIQKLLGRIGDQGKSSIFEYSLSWYTGEKQSLWSASAQVIGLLLCDRTLQTGKHLKSIVAVAKKIMESSVIASGVIQLDVTDETVLPLWKEAYHSVAMMERLLLRFPELYFEQNMEEIWIIVCKLLIHPHSMLRNLSSSLVASYFSTVERRKREEKLDVKLCLLVQPSRLFIIAVSFLKQLRTELSDATANNLIVQNLAYSVCNLHMLIRRSTSSHQFWSSFSSSDRGVFLEGFELLGSSKAKNTFLLCTSTSTDLAGSSLDRSEEPTSLLVSSVLKRMGKIAMQMQDTQMKIVFNCFSMISSALGSEESLTYAIHLLAPLYKVSEGFAGKVISDEVKQLAEGVRDKLRDRIGVEKFVEAYNSVRKGLKQKRESRKQAQKIIAAVDPARHAKRKLRAAAKHQEHKRRKIMAMKMGRWMR